MQATWNFDAPLSPVTDNNDWLNYIESDKMPLPELSYAQNFDQSLETSPISEDGLNNFFDTCYNSLDTTHYNSPIKQEDSGFSSPDLNVVNEKLSLLKTSSSDLENVFDTQDILSRPRIAKRRAPRKKLTKTQKEAHNVIEKKYRININTKIEGLQKLIPCLALEETGFKTRSNVASANSGSRLNKSLILEKAMDYIIAMQSNEKQLIEENLKLRNKMLSLGGSLD